MSRVIVIGAGIIGLAVAQRLADRGDSVTVLEKEPDLARHQTGRNSGVIHSGLYYPPGSDKARMCRAGATSMVEFAQQHDIAHEITGKLVVATRTDELAQLDMLTERAARNGVPAKRLSPQEAREFEPNVSCVGALRVESTGIIDYRAVCRVLADQVRARGGQILFGHRFVSATTREREVVVTADNGVHTADLMVNCAGLFSDRVALASGVDPGVRIVPFRGEYFELTPQRSELVKGLIYPVPDPRFPFLGVHLTRMVDGSVHAGPNAVLALAREGYTWSKVKPRELANALAWPGLWKLASRNAVPGSREIIRSLSKERFARSLAELVPSITKDDLVRSAAGVRAQALNWDGSLVDDFAIRTAYRQLHVLNAPSPAATAALEIASHITERATEVTA